MLTSALLLALLFVSTLRSTVPGLLSPATTARDRAEQQDEHNQSITAGDVTARNLPV